jgi:hypothetical protein
MKFSWKKYKLYPLFVISLVFFIENSFLIFVWQSPNLCTVFGICFMKLKIKLNAEFKNLMPEGIDKENVPLL